MDQHNALIDKLRQIKLIDEQMARQLLAQANLVQADEDYIAAQVFGAGMTSSLQRHEGYVDIWGGTTYAPVCVNSGTPLIDSFYIDALHTRKQIVCTYVFRNF